MVSKRTQIIRLLKEQIEIAEAEILPEWQSATPKNCNFSLRDKSITCDIVHHDAESGIQTTHPDVTYTFDDLGINSDWINKKLNESKKDL